MKNVLKMLGHYKGAVALVMLLLLVQAFCDLALPTLTADVVDVGIEQNGIDGPVMERMSSETMQDILMFSDEKNASFIQNAYSTEKKGVFVLHTLDRESKANLNHAMLDPVVMVYLLKNAAGNDEADSAYKAVIKDVPSLEQLRNAYSAGTMQRKDLVALRRKTIDQLKNLNGSILNQIAVQMVKQEYEDLGLDVSGIQHAYLLRTGGRMIAMAVLMMLVSVLVGYMASITSSRVGRDMRRLVFAKVIGFSNREIDQFSTASLITRCTNDVQQIQFVIVMFLRIVLYAPIMAIGGIVMVVSSRTGLWWIIVVAVVLLGILMLSLFRTVMPKFHIMQTLVDRLNGVSREILTGIMVIRAFHREKHEEKRFDKANADVMKNQLFTTRVLVMMFPAMTLIMNGVTLAIVWFGGQGVNAGRMQVGDMMAFINYAMMIIVAFLMLTGISMMLPRAAVSADRIQEVLNEDVVIQDPVSPEDNKVKNGPGRIVFHHVSFRYPNAKDDVLHDIDFSIEPGETTAVIGSTGCGKSTLLNLIPRLYDVTEGSITLDGVDIRQITQKQLRSEIGYIPQKAVLFSGNIRSNIKYANEQMDDENMYEAAAISQSAEFILQKEEKYDSPISQGGSNVSGGQKQRLAIARALAKKDAKVFLFDDSFSALDFKTDRALRDALQKQVKNASVFIVAQRISTILHADKILVLDDGRIVGEGTHAALLKTCPEYLEIARSQLSEAEIASTEGIEQASASDIPVTAKGGAF